MEIFGLLSPIKIKTSIHTWHRRPCVLSFLCLLSSTTSHLLKPAFPSQRLAGHLLLLPPQTSLIPNSHFILVLILVLSVLILVAIV